MIEIQSNLNSIIQKHQLGMSSTEEALYSEQLFRLQILQEKVNHIQDNVASARHGILNPNILTDEET